MVLLKNFLAVILGLGGRGRGSGPASASTISLATLCMARRRALSSNVSSEASSFVIFAIASLLEFIFNLIGAVMALNYYEVLEIPRSATEAMVNEAYRRLAPMWHPDNAINAPQKEHARVLFSNLAESYEVLSNPIKRGFYDIYGELGLKHGAPHEHEAFQGKLRFSGDPDRVYANFFATQNPFTLVNSALEKTSTLFGFAHNGATATASPPISDLHVKVECTLGELFNGCQKDIEFSIHTLTNEKSTTTLEKVTKGLIIKPGTTNGDQVRYPGEGNQAPNRASGDLVFTIIEIPHEIYRRQGDNLVYTVEMALVDALHARSFPVPGLDGRILTVASDKVINPKTEIIVANEGMPKSDGAGRGDLKIHFRILFPRILDEVKKHELKAVLT